MKLLSVIIPLYNSAPWLPKCLDSVLNQDVSEEDLEIICINDGSPDDSEQIAKRYQSDHPDSIVVLSQENQGPSGARNNGMRHASGKYLCFVDPDDFVEPNVFGGLVNQMEQQQLDVLRFNYQIVDEDYRTVKKNNIELKFDYSPCIMSGPEFLAIRLNTACNIWKYFYRTELVVANRIWCFTGDYFDDTPWLPLVLMKAARLGVCDKVVYDYQERSDSLVKASTLSAIRRKNEGGFLLIHLLQEELKGIEGEPTSYPNMEVLYTVALEPSVREGVVQWYKMMMAHTVLSMLTSTAVYDYPSTRTALKRLKAMNVFPLSVYRASSKNKKKIKFFNVAPQMTMLLMQIRKRIGQTHQNFEK